MNLSYMKTAEIMFNKVSYKSILMGIKGGTSISGFIKMVKKWKETSSLIPIIVDDGIYS